MTNALALAATGTLLAPAALVVAIPLSAAAVTGAAIIGAVYASRAVSRFARWLAPRALTTLAVAAVGLVVIGAAVMVPLAQAIAERRIAA